MKQELKDYLEWLGYTADEIENQIKEEDVLQSNQLKAFMAGHSIGFKKGLKAKINTTTVSDAPLEKDKQLEITKKYTYKIIHSCCKHT